MSTNKAVLGITVGLMILTGVLFFGIQKQHSKVSEKYSKEINIHKTWRLPEALEEISGIAFLDSKTVACIQDEDGVIFLYNLETSKIEKEIEFSGGGDYEGIAVSGNTAFVVESDGTLHKVENFRSDPKVSEHETRLTEKQDVEGLCFDTVNKQLLLAIKEKEPESDRYKGVYAVDPRTMQMKAEPVFRLNLSSPVLEEVEAGQDYDKFQPSEINIHPDSGEIFMLEGTNSKLLILDSNKKAKELHFLNRNDFPQPEGLSFDPSGNLYISNEGKPGTIHRISIN